MTISSRVQQEFYGQVHYHQPTPPMQSQTKQLIRIPPTKQSPPPRDSNETLSRDQSSLDETSTCPGRLWTSHEHDRFLEALELFPRGPWKAIAAHVGNKTARQVMSHGQKYRQKIARRKRGLKKTRERRKKSDHTTITKQKTQTAVHDRYSSPETANEAMMVPVGCYQDNPYSDTTAPAVDSDSYRRPLECVVRVSRSESPSSVGTSLPFASQLNVPDWQAATFALGTDYHTLPFHPQMNQLSFQPQPTYQQQSYGPGNLWNINSCSPALSNHNVNYFTDLLHPEEDPQQFLFDFFFQMENHPSSESMFHGNVKHNMNNMEPPFTHGGMVLESFV